MQKFLSNYWRAGEFILLIVGVPLLLYTVLPVKYLLPTIWGVTIYCYCVESLRQNTIWAPAMLNWTNIRPILTRFAISALLLTALTAWLSPQSFLEFPRKQPLFWMLIMVLYPLLSVIPQEIIFRSFFFLRFRPFFKTPMAMVIASGVAFGFAHILFHNWVAPLLCLIGGLMFAHTYQKRRSLLLVCFEHALYGDFLFTIGLGRYFYHGTVATALQH